MLHYARKGFAFHPLPHGEFFDKVSTDLLGRKIFWRHSHIDLVVGAIPEKRILAVDPHYYQSNRAGIDRMVTAVRSKLVLVPEQEAERHPACFLPLGGGKVLVDSGAPKFIAELRKAGAKVIPTAVPLDHLMELKGGLHCLFNEE